MSEGLDRRAVMFVEDPGAVNCIAPVAWRFVDRGDHPLLLSAGLATSMLQNRGLDPQPVGDGDDAVARFASVPGSWLLVGTSENPDSAAFALIHAAREADIRSIGFVDFAANAAYRFRGRTDNPLAHAPDWLLVPDGWTAGEFAALGFPQSRVAIVGHPHYDYLAEVEVRLSTLGRGALRERLLPEAARGRTVVVVASEISTGLDPQQYRRSEEYTLSGRGQADGRTEIVVEELLDAIDALATEGIERPFLILRRHPKESEADLAAYLTEFDQVSRGDNALDLIFAADIVLGLSSMLLAEAHALGIPTLAVLPRASERDWLAVTRTGAIPCLTDRASIRTTLRRWLAAPPSRILRGGGDLSDAPAGSLTRILAFLEQEIAA